jgi:DNA invertase Pin-like site-specific DNA recombinase
MIELQNMCADLAKRGVILISTTQDIDISKPMGKMFIAVLGWMAEMERDNISERTKLGMVNKKAIAEEAGKPWKKRKFFKYNSKGPPPVHRSKAMLARLRELRDLKFTWDRIVEKLAYENIEWKISATTARNIYGRMYAGTQGRT